MSVFDILDDAAFPEDSAEICMRQDLNQQLKQLNGQLARAAKEVDDESDQRLGVRRSNDHSATEIEEEITRVEEKMRASVLTFHMRGVSTEEYQSFQRLAGRPRKGFQQDLNLGYNVEEMLKIAIRECTFKVEAPDGSEEKFLDQHWRKLWKSINDAQFDDLVACVQNVNRRTARVPTPARSFESQNGSEQNLKLPMDLGSAESDSTDGNHEELQQLLSGQMTDDQSDG